MLNGLVAVEGDFFHTNIPCLGDCDMNVAALMYHLCLRGLQGFLDMHPARSTSVDVSSPVQQFVCYPAMSPGNQLRILHLAATTMEATVDSALALRQQLDQLAQGSFVEHGVNVLAFGLPGTGKTHALCALGHRLVASGHSVLFASAYRLVQDLLAATGDLALPQRPCGTKPCF